MKIIDVSIKDLKPYEKNPRKNDAAVNGVAESIKEFGFQQPLVIDSHNVIVAGHTRYKAAIKLGLDSVPCVRAEHLTKEQVKAYRILDNKLNELAEWDFEKLAEELEEIQSDFATFDVAFPPISSENTSQLPENGANVEDSVNNQPDIQNASESTSDSPENKREQPCRAEWVNMPDIRNKDLASQYFDVLIVFQNVERKIELGRILQIPITENTQYIYYPDQPEKVYTTDTAYV